MAALREGMILSSCGYVLCADDTQIIVDNATLLTLTENAFLKLSKGEVVKVELGDARILVYQTYNHLEDMKSIFGLRNYEWN